MYFPLFHFHGWLISLNFYSSLSVSIRTDFQMHEGEKKKQKNFLLSETF